MTNRYPTGSVEYLSATVTADVELDAQPVVLSIDQGVTWLPATWQGDAGTTRTARTTTPVTFDNGDRSTQSFPVYVRVTDSPEIPVMHAGTISVTDL